MRKRSTLFRMFCVVSFVASLFSMSFGFSDYVVSKSAYDETGTLSSQAMKANESGDKVTVNFKYIVYYESNWENVSGYTDRTVSSRSEYNDLKSYFSNNIDSTFDDSYEPGQYGPFSGKSSSSDYNFRFIVNEKVYKKYTKYYGKYTIQKQKKGFFSNDFNNEIKTSISINKGTSLNSYDLEKYFDVVKDGYTFAGLKINLSDSTFMDLSALVNQEMTYYAVFYSNEPLVDRKIGNLTTTINSTGGTREFWKGNSDWIFDVSKDSSYNQVENKVYLGTSYLKTTVKFGATIRFNLNNGKESMSMDVDSNQMNFEPEDEKHDRQYTVALANDLIVNGAFTIGGHFGNKVNYGRQGHIMNEYVCLDLNGHDIYVNSEASLWSYGLIKDSVGTGHIYVNGNGQIYTLVGVMDYRGGGATLSYKNAKVFPFIYYTIPYIRTSVIFNYKDGWGGLNAIFHLTAAVVSVFNKNEYIHTTSTLKFIGTGTDCLFRPDGGMNNSSRIIFEGYQQQGISSDMCIGRRSGLTIENAKLIMGAFVFTIDAGIGAIGRIDIDTKEYNFPVNPFFDVRLVNSTLIFSQRIQFMAGMSFIADKDSTVVFTTNGSYSAQLSILDKGANYYDNRLKKMITTDNSGNDYSYENYIRNNTNFWKYYSQPKIKIYGKLLFTKGNTDSKMYKLIGPCDFNEDNVGVIDGNNTIMYDKSRYSDPFTFLNKNGVSIQTYGFDYQISHDSYHVRGFSRPLVSNGKAYAVKTSDVKIGTYSFTDCIFRMANGECYYFNNDGSFALGDAAGNTMNKCTVTNHVITDGSSGTKYVYFASMYGQYDASAGTVNLGRISKTATAVKVSYSNDATRWLRS